MSRAWLRWSAGGAQAGLPRAFSVYQNEVLLVESGRTSKLRNFWVCGMYTLVVSISKILNDHRWAVKEAAYKALYPLRPTWKELTYTSFDPETGSKPTLAFQPGDGTVSSQLHVSVSHDGEYIVAHVVAENVA